MLLAEPPRKAVALPARWNKLIPHPEQMRLVRSPSRFRVVAAGRRSGKTERAKRFGVKNALRFTKHPDGLFVFGAPTHEQARRIFWKDLKALVHPNWLIGRPEDSISESRLEIELYNGCRLRVVGLDRPERVEGEPVDAMFIDEYGNIKPDAWSENLRPCLSTPGRRGMAWLFGVPEGRNHFHDDWSKAGLKPGWDAFHWTSEEILDPEEIADVKEELDPLTYAQEYLADFVNFRGRAYYGFDVRTHAAEQHERDPKNELCLAFDFNVRPGVCAAIQEKVYDGRVGDCAEKVTAVVDEIYVERDSNTMKICNEIKNRWGDHEGYVVAYGDATGGADGTAKIAGSDWEIIAREMRAHFGDRFGMDVPKANPRERVRVNAVNSRIKSTQGTIRFVVDRRCKHTIKDFEGVITKDDGSIDKKKYPMLTHISDAIGYYVSRRHPLSGGRNVTVREL